MHFGSELRGPAARPIGESPVECSRHRQAPRALQKLRRACHRRRDGTWRHLGLADNQYQSPGAEQTCGDKNTNEVSGLHAHHLCDPSDAAPAQLDFFGFQTSSCRVCPQYRSIASVKRGTCSFRPITQRRLRRLHRSSAPVLAHVSKKSTAHVRSSRSNSAFSLNSLRSRARSACSVSDCAPTDPYSPAALDMAPATSPATPAIMNRAASRPPRQRKRSSLRSR